MKIENIAKIKEEVARIKLNCAEITAILDADEDSYESALATGYLMGMGARAQRLALKIVEDEGYYDDKERRQ